MVSSEVNNEIRSLLWQLEEGEATDSQVSRLDDLVTNDEKARQYFLQYSRMLADLRFGNRPLVSPPEIASERVSFLGAAWDRINTVWGVSLTIATLVLVAVLSMLMCTVAGAIALRKLSKAEPASLF